MITITDQIFEAKMTQQKLSLRWNGWLASIRAMLFCVRNAYEQLRKEFIFKQKIKNFEKNYFSKKWITSKKIYF